MVVELQKEMHNLYKDILPLASVDQIPKHDVYVSVGSLPLIFKTNLSSIPPPLCVGHLKPIKNRIGVLWKGNPKTTKNAFRSIDVKLFDPIFNVSNFEYVSLEINPTLDEIKYLEERKVQRPKIANWVDIKNVIETCELVISIDSAIAHLAGSMGVPTWILLALVPDFRWMLKREDSPWYDSVRLWRQSIRRSWKEPIDAVRNALIKMGSKHG